MKDLGWKRGHKHNWCRAKGYAGLVKRNGSSYGTGNYCYEGDQGVCNSIINP
jgi:hypothetical protein